MGTTLLLMDLPTVISNPLIIMLSCHINNYNGTQFHQLPLLLPVTHQQLTRKRRITTIDLLYKSIDMLPCDYDQISINHNTNLHLPLHIVFYRFSTSSFRIPKLTPLIIVYSIVQRRLLSVRVSFLSSHCVIAKEVLDIVSISDQNINTKDTS